MARISGVDLPKNKKILYGLQYIYGIGPTSSSDILGKEYCFILPGMVDFGPFRKSQKIDLDLTDDGI